MANLIPASVDTTQRLAMRHSSNVTRAAGHGMSSLHRNGIISDSSHPFHNFHYATNPYNYWIRKENTDCG
jgi:hypothetical protein